MENKTTFKRIRKELEKETAANLKAAKAFILNGAQSSYEGAKDAGIRRYLTATAWSKYTAGEITRAEAIAKSTKRAERGAAKTYAANLAKIEEVENAPTLYSFTVQTEWKRSRIWGRNPSTRINIHTATGWTATLGAAGGCGYDKASAAIADALNASPAILKVLYTAEENRLKSKEYRKHSRREVVGYGSGYGALPYFEGGVGVNCFAFIFNNAGFKWRYIASGDAFDVYTVEAANND